MVRVDDTASVAFSQGRIRWRELRPMLRDSFRLHGILLIVKARPFRLEDKVDVDRTARRFEVSTGHVKDAVRQVMEERGEVTLSVTRQHQELVQYIRSVYDEQAKAYSFHDMVHMLAVFHTELLSRAIVNPERFAREGAKIGADIAKFVYPKETATITRTLPPGESREMILSRVLARLGEQNLLPPGPPGALSDSNTQSSFADAPGYLETDTDHNSNVSGKPP